MKIDPAQFLYQNRAKIMTSLLIILPVVWAITATIQLQRMEPETKVFYLSKSGPIEVSKASEASDLQSEIIKNFITVFIMRTYNFTEQDFLEKSQKASYMLTEKLWNASAQSISNQYEDIKSRGSVKIGTIDQFLLVTRNEVRVRVLSSGYENNHTDPRQLSLERKDKMEVRFKLVEVPFSPTNQWGYEIEEINTLTL